MVNSRMCGLGQVRSAIRDLFEYGNMRAEIVGREDVYDYSLGNPSVPAPEKVNDTIKRFTDSMGPVTLHGYTSAQGDAGVRTAIADNINKKFDAGVKPEDIYMTCGAAASLCITFNALAEEKDEFVAIAPFFPEYKVFAEDSGAKFVVCEPDYEKFMINFDNLEKVVNKHTKGIVINFPNNPTGVIPDMECIYKLVEFLKKKSEKFGHPIFLITDEPYRELNYDNKELPYFINMYDYTIVCYSFSKSLSLPGERIGYIVVSNRFEEHELVYAAVCGAGRSKGYVCAPSMMQRVVAECLDITSDTEIYKTNRDILYNALTEYGYECIYPDGAFYLFVKAPEEDAQAFSERAKKYELLLVPADSFGAPGYVRLAYCVSTDMVKRSLPAFGKLIEEYK